MHSTAQLSAMVMVECAQKCNIYSTGSVSIFIAKLITILFVIFAWFSSVQLRSTLADAIV